jgi:CubicO group peptidase (beta-lactamase class C family)
MKNVGAAIALMVFLYVFLISSCTHISTQQKVTASLLKQIEVLRHQYAVPGASIAVISNGQIEPPISLGWANLEKKIPVRFDTLFQACSMTKTLTSALVLMEFERRKLSIDTVANQFLKRWQIPQHEFGVDVTVRMLLNHTGAISNPYPDGGAQWTDKKATLLEHFQGVPPALNPPLNVESEPGAHYKYCNGCYSILQMLIEDISGKDYRDLVKETILQPIGMNNSRFDDNLLDNRSDNVAINYNDEHLPHPPVRKLPIYATGSLWSTATDMAKFIIEIQRGLQGNSRIISKKIALELVDPSSTPTRGLGFFIGDRFGNEEQGGSYFFHGGQNIGYLAFMLGNRDGKAGAVVMINISSPWNSKDFPHFAFVKQTVKLISANFGWK